MLVLCLRDATACRPSAFAVSLVSWDGAQRHRIGVASSPCRIFDDGARDFSAFASIGGAVVLSNVDHVVG